MLRHVRDASGVRAARRARRLGFGPFGSAFEPLGAQNDVESFATFRKSVVLFLASASA